jgi:hypothetical protein
MVGDAHPRYFLGMIETCFIPQGIGDHRMPLWTCGSATSRGPAIGTWRWTLPPTARPDRPASSTGTAPCVG